MLVNKISKVILPAVMALSTTAAVNAISKPDREKVHPAEQNLNRVYSYYDKDNKLQVVDVKIGDSADKFEKSSPVLDKLVKYIDDGDGKYSDRDYIMLDRFMALADSKIGKTKNDGILQNAEIDKMLKIMQKGKLSREDLIFIQTPEIFEIDNWSEGLDRRIRYIKIVDGDYPEVNKLKADLSKIGEEVGFKVVQVKIDAAWLEDYTIRRFDGKYWLPGAMLWYKGELYKEDPSIAIGKTIEEYDRLIGKSYLEGGNVLNTLTADGKPAAIVGENSVDDTAQMYGMEELEKNRDKARKSIAADLGLSQSQVTFIPQHDFHIDMFYRPLQNGVVAVADYESAIKYLKENDIKSMPDEHKEALLADLEDEFAQHGQTMKDAEKVLNNAGYKTIKIPAFNVTAELGASDISYMNGVCGTSPEGIKFYITNKSGYEELDGYISECFKSAGVDKVFFVDTLDFLLGYGGVDCLTQEM